MKDRNGVEIRTGDIVKVENAFFKSQNGLFLVTDSPGDASWDGSSHSMVRIGKKGGVRETDVAFWPLASYVSSREVRCTARDWNELHATIEVQPPLKNMAGAIGFFQKEVEREENSRKWLAWNGHDTTLSDAIITERMGVADRLSRAG